jgi:hypothetical protein
MRFSSCRTLPGHSYLRMAMSAFGVKPFTFTFISWAYFDEQEGGR